MAKKPAMTPIDFTHLQEYEQEWVALTDDLKVVEHAAQLRALRHKLGEAKSRYRYVFVPPSGMGFSGPCPV